MIKPQHLISSSENFKLNKINGIRIEKVLFDLTTGTNTGTGGHDVWDKPQPPGGGTGVGTEIIWHVEKVEPFRSVRFVEDGDTWYTVKKGSSYVPGSGDIPPVGVNDIVPVSECINNLNVANYHSGMYALDYLKVPFLLYPMLVIHHQIRETTLGGLNDLVVNTYNDNPAWTYTYTNTNIWFYVDYNKKWFENALSWEIDPITDPFPPDVRYIDMYTGLSTDAGEPQSLYESPLDGDMLFPGKYLVKWQISQNNYQYGLNQDNYYDHNIWVFSKNKPVFTTTPINSTKYTDDASIPYYTIFGDEFDITVKSNFYVPPAPTYYKFGWASTHFSNSQSNLPIPIEINSIYTTSNTTGILKYTVTIYNSIDGTTTTYNNIISLGGIQLNVGVNTITWTVENVSDYAWTGNQTPNADTTYVDGIEPFLREKPKNTYLFDVTVVATDWKLKCSSTCETNCTLIPCQLIQGSVDFVMLNNLYDAVFSAGGVPVPPNTSSQPIITHNYTPCIDNTTLVGCHFTIGTHTIVWETTFLDAFGDSVSKTCTCDIVVEDLNPPEYIDDCVPTQNTKYRTVGFIPKYIIQDDEFDKKVNWIVGDEPTLSCIITKNGVVGTPLTHGNSVYTIENEELEIGKNIIEWTVIKGTLTPVKCTITVYVGQILGKNGGDAISTICLGATNIEYRVDGGPGVTNYTWNLEYAVGAYISNSFTTSSNPIKLNFPIMLSPGSYIEVSYYFVNQPVTLRFYISTVASDGSGYQLLYYDNQTLSIETQRLNTNEFDLDKYIESEFDYFDYFFRNTRYINDEGDYVQTTHYSIFNNGDDYTPSSTVFKGIKYNAHKLKGLIRNESSKFIEQYLIDNSENYNGYKFSVILNTKYDRLTESLNKIYGQSTQITTGSTTPSQSVISTTLNDNAANGKQWSSTNSLHVFVNDKYKNILVIIDMSFNLKNGYSLTLNNVSHFDQREGLYLNYENTTFDYGYLNYDSDVLIANNYISSINNLNDPNLFEDYISFYYIDSIGDFGYSKINGVNINSNDFASIPSWNNNFPPIRLECELPNSIDTKKKSFNIAAIKGPKFNIYDKFKTDFKENVYDKSFIKEPLSRYITINEYESKQTKTYTKELEYNNTIFRYNGPYEPIFKTVELFAPTYYSVVNSSIFSQNKSGGFLAANVNSSSELQLSLSELNQEEIKLSNTVDYINNKFIDIYDDITYANIINDNIVKVKLNNDLVFYNNLMLSTQSAYTSTLSSITFLTQYLTNNVPPVGGTNWIFKDKILGLCDGNNTTCEINLNSPSVFYKNSEELNINNFGFNIPLDSTITGIKISIKKFAKNGYRQSPLATYTTVVDNNIYLIKPNGIDKSNNIALNPSLLINLSSPLNTDEQYFWPTASTLYEYGGVDDLFGFTGNTILTPQEINNKNFGLSLSVTGYKLNNTTYVNIANIDCVSITVYYTVNSLEIGKIYTSSIDRNTKFDTDLCHFGEISELIYSKVNEKESPLKIQGTEEDRSIYPMIDEFGYTWDRRFIFKSSWDADYYRRTKNEIE